MATFTVTTPVNIDTLTSKAGGDTYNINGGYLTIDQDSRVGLNQTTSSTLGAMTLSATLGGTVEINSTLVRIIPYNTGTGNVPAWNTTISQGGASGLLIGVYSALNVASTATGAAMPASGYIKIKQWNSTPYAAGALTGIGATATGADTAGWLEIVGDEAGTVTVNRLNLFKVRGAYFDLGTTDGTRATTYQIPSSGMLQYHAGVEVETGTGTGVYEFYPCAGTLTAVSTVFATDAVRGKVCWISTAGLLRFGHDGTNSTGGYIPPTGRKIRIANIFMANATTAARTANVLPNATLATRYEFATTGGGVMDIDKCSSSWYFNLNQPYSVAISNTGICTAIVLTEVAQPMTITNMNIGQEAANTQIAITMNLCFAGGTFTDCNFARTAQAASGAYVVSMTDISGFDFTNTIVQSYTKAANATTGSLNLVRAVDCTFTTTKLGAGRAFLTTCTDVTMTTTTYYDHPAVNTLAAIPMYAFDIGTNCLRCTFDGLDFGGLYMTQPYNGILNVGAAGCTDIKLRNIGSYASPLSLGKPRVDDGAWTRVTTTITVTETAHPFLVNDTIYVVVSSDTGAIVVGAKTITAVTANTFTFTGLNAGAASGTICYFGTKCANVFVLAASSAANGLKVQRVYAPHTRTNLYTTDNSAKNITMENLFSDFLNAPLIAMLNGYSKGVSGTPPLTAQSSVYGTHWFNGYVCDVATNNTGQSYTRSTTTVTVTSAGHSLRTGMLIQVNPSAAPTTFTTGTTYSVTVTSSSTFTIPVANAGAASGTLDYRVANGRIGLVMNEATSDTLDRYSLDAGNPAFTSAGGLYMPTIGDQVTFVTPNYLIGQGSTFPPFEPVMAGSTLTRYTITYALDKNDGNGYGSFHNMYYERTGGGGTSGTTTVTMTDTTGVEAGDYVWGTNVSPQAYVVSVDSGTNITVSANNIGTVSGTLRFGHLPSETGIDPALGVKMKWRITTVTTNTAAITSLYIQTESTDAGRANQYPLEVATATYSFSGLEIGTEVVLFNSANTELDRQVISGTTYEYAYSWNSDDGDSTGNYALIWKDDKYPIKFTSITLGATNVDVPIAQADDLVYLAASTDNLTVDFANSLIIMDGGAVEYDVQGVYSIWKDTIRLTNNAQYDFAFSIVGGNTISSGKYIPFYTFQANGWKVRPDEADHTLNVVGGVLVGEAGADPFVDTLGAYTVRILFEQPVQAITVSTGGGGGATAAEVWAYATRRLSATGITDITTGLATEANATTNANDIQSDIAGLPTAATIADAVLDEAVAGHQTSGSLGKVVKDGSDSAELASIK